MFEERNKGKIIIQLEQEQGKINSTMRTTGLAKIPETAITTLLVNFVSLSLEKGKNPRELIDKHFDAIVEMLSNAKKIG
ncbi:MAG: hypothetical protein HC819_06570 [Cyclobacteriaceae bacterium]|nr:hypothetical protein [Cyclobacteriaceae bacterium]